MLNKNVRVVQDAAANFCGNLSKEISHEVWVSEVCHFSIENVGCVKGFNGLVNVSH